MSKQSKTHRAEPTPPTPAPAAQGPAAAPAAQAAADAAPAATPTGVLGRVLAFAHKRLQGTRVERLAKRATDAAAKLPALAERELDAALDRLGLVRKSKAAHGSQPTTGVTVSAIKAA